MVVEDVVRGQLVEVCEQAEPVMSLDVVEAVGENLQEGVQGPPGLLGEHLGQKLVQEAFDTQGLYL